MENQMVIFLHSVLDFTLKTEGPQLVLQSWILRDKFEHELGCLEEATPDYIAELCDQIPQGPLYHGGEETSDIMSFGLTVPGQTCAPEHYWSLLSSGADGIIKVPITRWDNDMYYTDSQEPGKMYCQHFGMIDTEQLQDFDHEFFGYKEEEVFVIDPAARNMMEAGYEALHRGGWHKNEIKGKEMAHIYGYAESEYVSLSMRGMFGVNQNTRHLGMACATASRLHYTLGSTGPCSTIETACSSSLTATALMHIYLRPAPIDAIHASARKQVKYGLSFGGNAHFDPFYTVALCGASMLTHAGRCFTFDQSGDGFVRGEGQASMYIKQSTREDYSRLNMLCGSCMNQDGRSASMTAPHGPSQQECIRASLREGAIDPSQIQIQELHGTGTALGDPIEVGALRATMMTVNGKVRDRGLVKTSSKSNIGHTELTAGLCGLMKCVLLGINACAAPNVHLRLLNPHIDYHAYPVFFTSEYVDQGHPCGYNGVSSFGFGGSNARGDVWARALNGPRTTNPPEWLFDLSYTRIKQMADVFGEIENATKDVVAIQADGGLTEYDGDYLVGNPFSSDNEFFLEGSFNGWAKSVKMTFDEEKETWSCPITLGDTRVEHFRINVNGYSDAQIFPTKQDALREQVRVLGPGTAPPGQYFVIDGTENGTEQGTVYNIVFWYDAQTRQKMVKWEPTIQEDILLAAAMHNFTHSYYICGSWNNFIPMKIPAVKGVEPGLHSMTFRIGVTGQEEFNFLRDGKADEVIYPSQHRALEGDVPVRGPDMHGKTKYFGILGDTGDVTTIQLQVWDGEITVTTNTPSRMMTSFRRILGDQGKRYFLLGEWNKRYPTLFCPTKLPNVFEATMVMPNVDWKHRTGARFHIIEDRDTRQAIHPEMPDADQGVSCALGPDANGEGLDWSIVAEYGQTVVVTLDMSQLDRRKVVTWQLK